MEVPLIVKIVIDKSNIPEHIAIIMDGNGRWAKKRFLTKSAGHKAGAIALKKLSKQAHELGVKYLTVYAFSTENWTRPQKEISELMNLLRQYIKEYIDDAKNNDLRIKVIGDIQRLDEDLQDKIRDELKIILKQTSTTTIFVTHDRTDAVALADRVVVLNKGQIKQIGQPSII